MLHNSQNLHNFARNCPGYVRLALRANPRVPVKNRGKTQHEWRNSNETGDVIFIIAGLLNRATRLSHHETQKSNVTDPLNGSVSAAAARPFEKFAPAMKELCWFQARPLREIMERRIAIEVGTNTDPAMWPILSNVFTTYQQDAKLMEQCGRCLRFAVRCVKYTLHGSHENRLLGAENDETVVKMAKHESVREPLTKARSVTRLWRISRFETALSKAIRSGREGSVGSGGGWKIREGIVAENLSKTGSAHADN
ncbi:Transportin-3 [Eufriesea mexicana]|nr:Transportin-3 [Eufriesea mexicana]